MRPLPIFLVSVLSLSLAARQEDAASLSARARAALAPISGELEIAGLQKPVEVIRDTDDIAPEPVYVEAAE